MVGILVSYQPSVDVCLLSTTLLLHAVYRDSPCLHMWETELVGQFLRAETAGSKCSYQCALQHRVEEVPVFPTCTNTVCVRFGFYIRYCPAHPQEAGLTGELQSRAEKGRPQDTRNPVQSPRSLWLREEPCAGERGCCPVAWVPSGHGAQHGYPTGDQSLGFLSEIVCYGLFT